MTSDQTEQFKTNTTSTLRAMARKGDVDITYSALEMPTGEITSLARPRLPTPTPDMDEETRALIRGCADNYALKIAHHNPALHHSNGQSDLRAQAAMDALEQARCDAIGMNTMDGVAGNLNAILEAKSVRRGFNDIREREDMPLADALHIVARTALTGQEPPHSASKALELWQPWINEHLGDGGLETLKGQIHDQHAFAKAAQKILFALNLPVNPEGEENTQELVDQENGSNEAEPKMTALTWVWMMSWMICMNLT